MLSDRWSLIVVDDEARPTARAVLEYLLEAEVELREHGPLADVLDAPYVFATPVNGRVVLTIAEWPAALVKGDGLDQHPGLEARVIRASYAGRVAAFVRNLPSGWFGFAVWEAGELVRRLEIGEQDVSEGDLLPCERRFVDQTAGDDEIQDAVLFELLGKDRRWQFEDTASRVFRVQHRPNGLPVWPPVEIKKKPPPSLIIPSPRLRGGKSTPPKS
ncbi:MAG: hypothetical protein ABMB14_26290 [Myxococcota bacterium]